MFVWDDANLRHIAEHEVSSDEAEKVILNDPIDLGFEITNGEERFSQVGETFSGRVLLVVTRWRGDKIRVVTAYPAPKPLRMFYLNQKRGNYG